MAFNNRLVVDICSLDDGVELEIDNTCHFLNICAAYEGIDIWSTPEQHVYNPIFGNNLDNPETRDISIWNDTKYVSFIRHNVSLDIWCPYRELVAPILTTKVEAAYSNIVPPLCNFSKVAETNQEVIIDRFYYIGDPYSIYTYHIHKPIAATVNKKYPVLFLVTGLGSGDVFDTENPFTGVSEAVRLTAMGFVVVHFNPCGRGNAYAYNNTQGIENRDDWYGHWHQDGFKTLIETISSLDYIDPLNIGIYSSGTGLVLAAGTLARYPTLPVKYLIDYEGPIDRVGNGCNNPYGEIIDHNCTDDAWWEEREAKNYISAIKCRYLRVQFDIDHRGNPDPYYFMDFVNMATNGSAEWTRVNSVFLNKENKVFTTLDRPNLFSSSSSILFKEDSRLIYEMSIMESLPREIPAVIIGELTSEVSIECTDCITSRDTVCQTNNMISESRFKVSIEGMRLRGYIDPDTGQCHKQDELAYLCNRRGVDTNVTTIYSSHRNRFKANINSLLQSTSKQVQNSLISLNFEDPFLQLDGKTRKFEKMGTNIVSWKPLKYSLRLAPDTSKLKSAINLDSERSLQMFLGSTSIVIYEVPMRKNEPFEALSLDLKYMPFTPSPPADISLVVVPKDQDSANAFPLMGLKFLNYKGYKVPLCIYDLKQLISNPNITTEYAVVDFTSINKQIMLDTLGWGMKLRIKIFSDNVNAPIGKYIYTLRYVVSHPAVFGESIYGDFFGENVYFVDYPFYVIVR